MPQIPAPLPLNSLLRAGGLSVSGSTPGPAQSAIAQPTSSTPQDRLQTTAAGSASASLHLGQPPLIGPGTRVLHIGDSHTVGIYGREMDKMLRATGAQVASYGSAGSSPRWWLDGTTTRSGYFGSGEDGKIDAPADWRTPRQTPKLPDLLKKHQPSVVMISLGANLLGADGATIEKQVKQLAEVARTSGAKIVWVGPPDGRESNKPTSKQAALYKHLQQAASQYGTFIDSRPLTAYPASGGDGVHYWGKEGTKIARNWAQEVFEQVQASAP